MAYSDDELDYIYDKTGGRCTYCYKQLAFVNYGRDWARGAWHVDHSVPRSRGGTNYLRNLVPACVTCNLDKGARTGKAFKASVARQETPVSVDVGWRNVLAFGAVVVGLALLGRAASPGPPPTTGPWGRRPRGSDWW